MIKLEKDFDSRSLKEMDKFIDDYLKAYHPAGYGTEVKIEVCWSNEEGNLNYKVKIERWESCD